MKDGGRGGKGGRGGRRQLKALRTHHCQTKDEVTAGAVGRLIAHGLTVDSILATSEEVCCGLPSLLDTAPLRWAAVSFCRALPSVLWTCDGTH